MFDLNFIKRMPYLRGDFEQRKAALAKRREEQDSREKMSPYLSKDGVLGEMDAHFYCVDQNGVCKDPYIMPAVLEALWGPWGPYFDPPVVRVRLPWNKTANWVQTMPPVYYTILKKEVHRVRKFAQKMANDRHACITRQPVRRMDCNAPSAGCAERNVLDLRQPCSGAREFRACGAFSFLTRKI